MPFNKKISGFQNELEFVYALNNKKFQNISFTLQEFLLALYGNIKPNEIIYVKLNYEKQKSDMSIWVRDIEKRVSIKKGIKNSVHVESLNSFIQFLKIHKMPSELIEKLLYYHYGDGTINGTGKNRVSSEEYRKLHQSEIDEINAFFNRKDIIKEAINRFVLIGNCDTKSIDVILYGVVEDFLWITKEEINEVILSNHNIRASGVHFGSLFYQPMTRCLNYNSKYEKMRHNIQIKWYHLSDDIIEMMNKRSMK